jgi:transcription initiation factor IIE alpha subunit
MNEPVMRKYQSSTAHAKTLQNEDLHQLIGRCPACPEDLSYKDGYVM